jgi:hypothetical protein
MMTNEKLTYYSDDSDAVVEFSADSDYWWKDEEGMTGLSNDIYTSQGNGQDGVYVTGMQLAAREITATIQIKTDYATARADLLSSLNPKHIGRLVYEDGTITRYIPCRISKAPVISRDVYPECEIDFFCASPFWREGDGTEDMQANISRWVGNLEFPIEIPAEGIEMGYRMPSLVTNIVNTGDVPAELTIEFCADADVSDPKLTSILTQEFLELDYDMLAGDCIRVTTGYGKKAATLIRGGVETSVFNYVTDDSTWLQLAVGDNFLRAEASDDDLITVRIMYEFMYL